MSSFPYTRADLKGLKAERDKQIHDQAVEQLVQQISQSVIGIAQTTNKTQFIYSRQLPANKEDPSHKIMADVIERLKERCVDVSIEYKFQTDIRTGREFNHGVYVDWT